MSDNAGMNKLLMAALVAAAFSVAPAAEQPLPSVDASAALKTVAPDLDARLARFKPVKMPYNSAALSMRERQMVEQLVIALRQLENICWRQSDPEGLALYKALEKVNTPLAQKTRHYLWINGSRWDLVNENEPFVGKQPMPPGHALYPADLTRSQVDASVAAHPDKKALIFDPYTIVRRQGNDLVGAKYHDEYVPFIKAASAALEKAADLSDDAAFAKFLRLRGDALFTDDYFASDIAWVELNNPKFDVIYAPYETYLDDLLGVKTSYGASILIRNDAESQKLALYQKWVPDIQDALPLAPADRPSVRGHVTPMEVMDAPFRAGDLRHGYQAVADNLPNDPRIHEQKGSKKIFFKNFMDARVNYVVLPIAKRLMHDDQAAKATGEGYLAAVLLHEISHGLGPAYARQAGKQVDIREAIGPTYSGLEEAKADVVGMFGLKWLVDRGAMPKERLEEYYASYVAGIFRTLRFGTGEAHGRAEMMEFNYLLENGALSYAQSRYAIDYRRIPSALGQLTKELLTEEATGDRARVETWFAKYGKMPK